MREQGLLPLSVSICSVKAGGWGRAAGHRGRPPAVTLTRKPHREAEAQLWEELLRVSQGLPSGVPGAAPGQGSRRGTKGLPVCRSFGSTFSLLLTNKEHSSREKNS